jgi:antitoxin ParD1/3/4
MGKLERVAVDLPEELVAKLHAAVDSGEYATTSDVVREALRDWNKERIRSLRSVQELRAMIEAADKSPTVDGEKFMAELRERVASEAARRGAL